LGKRQDACAGIVWKSDRESLNAREKTLSSVSGWDFRIEYGKYSSVDYFGKIEDPP
jgi:hypothetical protein